MSVEDKTEFIIAIRNYKYQKIDRHMDFIDVTASSPSNEKILLRSIEPQGKTGFVGIDDVKNMMKVMKHGDYDHGVLISKRFTEGAVQEMAQENIQQISDEYMPPFDTEKLYLAINNCINNQCKVKCGGIPLKESDCKGHLKGSFCKVRALSDNSSFHFAHGWIDLMKNDLKQLLSLTKAIQ